MLPSEQAACHGLENRVHTHRLVVFAAACAAATLIAATFMAAAARAHTWRRRPCRRRAARECSEQPSLPSSHDEP
jgi:phage-related protein